MSEVVLGKEIETGEAIAIGDRERGGGFYILGEPRTGKSHLMISMALQDMAHDHPVVFIDPHTDAITAILNHLPLKRQQDVLLLDPTDKTHAFGLNPLQCDDPSDPMELDRAYGRVQDIFIKLWPNEQGRLSIWMEKILQNAVYLLLENPGYTLMDMPLLLSEDTSFRNSLLRNVTVNPYVKDFWFDEFDRLSRYDKTEQVGPLLSRLNSFVRNTMLRHLVGQSRSTIDFRAILNTSPTRHIVLLRMPVTLPDTVKSVIGTMLISELLAAAFERDQLPESERRMVAVYCDEFQLFTTPDFAKLFTQTGKFKLMPVVAHQVREGQLKPDDPNTGATLAAPNKAFFSLSITDSPKVAPLMAKRVEATEKRREAELVISPRPVEDLWERGHPRADVMDIRGQYFRLVEDLRNTPTEQYFKFDPFRMSPQYRRDNPVNFTMQEFDDWEWYRSSSDQLRRGIALLNQYYYDWMGKRYEAGKPVTNAQVELIINVIEAWGGVLGFLPMLRPVLSDEKRARLTYTITEKLRQTHEQERQRKIGAARGELEYLEEFGLELHRFYSARFDQRGKPIDVPDIIYAAPKKGGTGLPPEVYNAQEKHREDLRRQIIALEQSQPPAAPSLPQALSSPKDVREVQTMALQAGMAGHEVEQLIEWEASPLGSAEQDALAGMVSVLVNREVDKTRYEREGDRLVREGDRLVTQYRQYQQALSRRLCPPGLAPEKATKRLTWQLGALQLFIGSCFRLAPRVLAQEPIKVPSGKYDETLTVERLQNDLIAEMGMELSRLPPHTAYVHVVQAKNGAQVVRQAKIRTLPHDPPHGLDLEEAIREHSREVAYKARTEIEADIRERQAKWRRGPGNKPPPTATRGDTQPPPQAPGPAERPAEPPPTHV